MIGFWCRIHVFPGTVDQGASAGIDDNVAAVSVEQMAIHGLERQADRAAQFELRLPRDLKFQNLLAYDDVDDGEGTERLDLVNLGLDAGLIGTRISISSGRIVRLAGPL